MKEILIVIGELIKLTSFIGDPTVIHMSNRRLKGHASSETDLQFTFTFMTIWLRYSAKVHVVPQQKVQDVPQQKVQDVPQQKVHYYPNKSTICTPTITTICTHGLDHNILTPLLFLTVSRSVYINSLKYFIILDFMHSLFSLIWTCT